IEKFRDPFGSAGGELDLPPDLRDFAKRTGGKDCIKNELTERAAGQLSGDDLLSAIPQDADDRSERQEDHRGGEPGARPRTPVGGMEGALRRGVECPARLILLDEGL